MADDKILTITKNSYQAERYAEAEADRINKYAEKNREAGREPFYFNARVEHKADSTMACRTFDGEPVEIPWFPWSVICDVRESDFYRRNA